MQIDQVFVPFANFFEPLLLLPLHLINSLPMLVGHALRVERLVAEAVIGLAERCGIETRGLLGASAE